VHNAAVVMTETPIMGFFCFLFQVSAEKIATGDSR